MDDVFASEELYGDGPAPAPPRFFATSDTGNAELIAARYGLEQARYDHARGRWLVWQGHRWGTDRSGKLYQWAIDCARYRASLAEDKPQQQFARASENAAKIKAALEVMSHLPGIADGGAGWDEDPLLLACDNGVVNLRDGTLSPGKPEQRITASVGYDYDRHAPAPTWISFIADLFPENPELIPYMQAALGYSISGSTTESVFWILHGSGSNGKSTLVETMVSALGEYAGVLAFKTIAHGGDNGIPSDLAALQGKRFIYSSETRESAGLNEARVKSLTGGDRITARALYQNEFTYKFVGHLYIAVNHRPKITDNSEGMWRRIRLIPFLAQFAGPTLDRNMLTKLQAERSGILRWLIDGCMMWQRDGLSMPAVVAVATVNYREESDPLQDWLSACCLTGEGYRARGGALYNSYRSFCQANGMSEREYMSATVFGKRALEKWHRIKSAGVVWYIGVGLLAEGGREGVDTSESSDVEKRVEEKQRDFSDATLPPSTCTCDDCPKSVVVSDVDCAGVEYSESAHCSVCCKVTA